MDEQNKLSTKLAGKVYEFRTCHEAWLGLTRLYLQGELPFKHPMYDGDYTIIVEKPAADINFAEAGLTKLRWKRFQTDYIHPGTFSGFMAEAKQLKAIKELNYIPPQSGEHLSGNCLIGMNIRSRDPRVAMYSRSSRWVPTAILDLSFAGLVCQTLAEFWNVDHVPLVWHIGRLNFSDGHLLIPMAYHGWEMPDSQTCTDERIIERMAKAREKYTRMMKTGTSYKTDRRIIINLRRITGEKGYDLHEDFYPEFSPFLKGETIGDDTYSTETLAAKFGIKPKDVKNFIRPFRAAITDQTGYRVPRSYSMVWPSDHPEVLMLRWCMENIRAYHSPEDVLTALGVESWAEVVDRYKSFDGMS